VAGWKAIVYKDGSSVSDSPLPMALGRIVSADNLLYHLLITVGLFGLIASFHGIILAAGRSSFEFGRVRFAPHFLGKIHSRFRTPANALLANMVVGIVALLTGETGAIITIAVFGALTLYIFSMVALLRLRKNEPALERPFRVPVYPALPLVALFISILSFLAMTIFNWELALIYFLIIGVCFGFFKIFSKSTG
jgi:ethanolamine permease